MIKSILINPLRLQDLDEDMDIENEGEEFDKEEFDEELDEGLEEEGLEEEEEDYLE
jgi:hypothetical protein